MRIDQKNRYSNSYQLRRQVEEQLWYWICEPPGSQVWIEVRDQVKSQIWDQVGIKIWNQIREQFINEERIVE